jgi:ribonuclease HI
MFNSTSLRIYTDGGSRGNPGHAATGTFIENEGGETLAAIGIYIGIATNNVAEYKAIIEGLEWILQNKNQMPLLKKIDFFMDSNLAASQLNGLYKIKNANLRELLFLAKQKEAEIKLPITYTHIPREKNKKADRLVNIALDNHLNLS